MWFHALEAQKERPAVTYGAIDLHSMQSQVRIVTDSGTIVDRRIPTTRSPHPLGGRSVLLRVTWRQERRRLILHDAQGQAPPGESPESDARHRFLDADPDLLQQEPADTLR